MKKIIIKSAKIAAWTILSFLFLSTLLVVLIQFPAIQNRIVGKTVQFLEEKIDSKVRIDRVEIGFPKKVVVKGFYLESQEKDTLLYVGELAVDFRFFKLLNSQIDIQSIVLNDFVANIKRDSNQKYNFGYIVDAFATEEKSEKDAAPFSIALNRINLNNVALTYDDKYEGNELNLKFNKVSTKIEEFDLEQMNFSVPKIELEGLKSSIKREQTNRIEQKSGEEEYNTAKKDDKAVNVKLKDIALSDIAVSYEDAVSDLYTDLNLKYLSVNIDNLDLPNRELQIRKITLDDTHAAVRLLKSHKEGDTKMQQTVDKTNAGDEMPWRIALNGMELKHLAVRFDDENAIALNEGMDFKHLDFSSINVEMKDFIFEPSEISGAIKSMEIKEKSGFDLQALKGDFSYGSQSAFLKNFYLKTAHTVIHNDLQLTYAHQNDLTDNQGEIAINMDFKNSEIAIKDILLFMPDLADQDFFKNNSNGIISTALKVEGPLKDLQIEKFYAKLSEYTVLDISGAVKGLPDVESSHIDIKINDLKAIEKDVLACISKESLPENIQLPERISAKGFFKGYLNNFDTHLAFYSSFGAVELTAQLDQRIKEREKYSIDAAVNYFDVGKLIGNDSLGAISIGLQASGEGFHPQTITAKFALNVSDAEFNNYHYKNLIVSGSLNEGNYALLSELKDPHLDFSINAEGELKAEELSLQLKADIKKVDLFQLNLRPEPFALKAKIRADFENLNPDKLQGELAIEDLIMLDDKEIYNLQTIMLKANSKDDVNEINIDSQIANLSMQGKYQLTTLTEAINKTMAAYFDLNDKKKDSIEKKEIEEIENQELKIAFILKDNPLLHQILPGLNNFEQFELTVDYQSNKDDIQLQGKIATLGYEKNKISNLVFDLSTEAQALKYNLSLLQLQGENFEINKMSLGGEVQNSEVSYNLSLKDKTDTVQYLIAGSCKWVEQQMRIKFFPNGFKLNYDNWSIAPDNLVVIDKEGINVQSFELARAGTKIKLQSPSNELGAPLSIDFVDFDILTLTEIVKKDSVIAKGVVNGKLELRKLKEKLLFISDLDVQKLEMMGVKIGNLSLKVDNNTPNQFNADITLSGDGNDVILMGFYDTESENLNLRLDVKQFQMKTIEGFSAGMMSNARGYLSGSLDIRGKRSKPSILGKIQFNKVGIHALALNSDFSEMNDAIDFTAEGLVVDRFSVSDSKQNKMFINGRVNTADYANLKFDLKVLSDNFNVISSTEKDNDLVYGDLFLALNLSFTGTLKEPELNGEIGINKNSNLTLVLPHHDPSVVDREGVVEFIDQHNQKLRQTLMIEKRVSESEFKGIDVSVAIHTDEETQFNVLIDKGNGDMIKLKGKADLSGGIDPSGKVSLTGRYEFSQGSYEMSFNFIKRKFNIQKGSSIVWNGDPAEATLDLTAIYDLKAAPIDLLEKQLSELTPSLRNMYKQKLPFQTLLMIKGELLKPEISFDIKLGETSGTISAEVISNTNAKLAQLRQEPSDLNKQIFALLILSRFIGENPFVGESSVVESMARESVSKMLSEQLNRMAADLIEGVDIDFDLQSAEDYTTGHKETRTDLNVALSKKLMDDRLKITIGSSFGLEGGEHKNEKSTNIAGDISAEYLLSKDGRYMLRAYRKNKYQVALYGQIVETGLGFIITMSYEQFAELFKAQREKEGSKVK